MPDPTEINPLTKADVSKLNKAMYNLNAAQLQVERAEAAGMDMEEELLRIAHQRKRIEGLLQVYGNLK